MTHGSLFAGVGGFDLGFEQSGFETIWQVENEPFCTAVLKTHFPNVERYYEINDCGQGRKHKLKPVDCITAGVPCQDVSVAAGKRAGLAGERTGLFYEFARILEELRPTWFVFENVPGLFSSNQGRDFAEALRVLMVQCGYGISWRVLDSQFFGVAQRRRRVFIVGYFGAPCPAEILFEPQSGTGNPSPSGEAWADLANAVTQGTRRVGSNGCDDGANIVCGCLQGGGHSGQTEPGEGIIVAAPLTHGSGITGNAPGRRREDDYNIVVARSLSGGSVNSGYRYDPNGEEYVVASTISSSAGHHGHSSPRGDGTDNLVCATLNSGGHASGLRTEPGEHLVAAPITASYGKQVDSSDRNAGPPNLAFALREDSGGIGQGWNTNFITGPLGGYRSGYGADEAGAGQYVSAETHPHRMRIAPVAPERLDDSRFELLPEGLDSARYRSLGNACTASVCKWIAERIMAWAQHNQR